jgi:hypothetical protein
MQRRGVPSPRPGTNRNLGLGFWEDFQPGPFQPRARGRGNPSAPARGTRERPRATFQLWGKNGHSEFDCEWIRRWDVDFLPGTRCNNANTTNTPASTGNTGRFTPKRPKRTLPVLSFAPPGHGLPLGAGNRVPPEWNDQTGGIQPDTEHEQCHVRYEPCPVPTQNIKGLLGPQKPLRR